MSNSNNGGPTEVLFAESDKEFVDVLFSFLTLPLGTIVRLLGKQSQIGCLDELYKSVENLSEDHFQTDACKAMLLRPCNAAASHCDRLNVKVDDTNPRAIYFIIFDDLQVAPASTSTMFPLLGMFGLHEQGNIQEKIINLIKTALKYKWKQKRMGKTRMPKPATVPNGSTLLWLQLQNTTSSRIICKTPALCNLFYVPQDP
ncbi:hypothetical protein E2562_014830 [Oryza meyeriana var. granulata]|uniref:Uncharacterized protein n=1 Tax=Oryza meyeriana var. granulata TaxID=110450 RepID=A0A6G1BV63_9ORYZ|nr:hypothetical protein E2562_014830 [Oryza meyeriana var. granulata]